MENNAKIRVINHQTIDGDTDVIEEYGSGIFSSRSGKHYIMYDVKTDDAKGRVTIIAEGRKVRIKRSGSHSSDMVYDTSRRTVFNYNTPYGILEMEVDTEHICNALNTESKKLRLKYTLTMQGQKTYNDTEILVEDID